MVNLIKLTGQLVHPQFSPHLQVPDVAQEQASPAVLQLHPMIADYLGELVLFISMGSPNRATHIIKIHVVFR